MMWLPVASIICWVIASIAAHCRTFHDCNRREWQAAYITTALAIIMMSVSMGHRLKMVPPTSVIEGTPDEYEPGEFVRTIDNIYDTAFEKGKMAWYAKQNHKPAITRQQL